MLYIYVHQHTNAPSVDRSSRRASGHWQTLDVESRSRKRARDQCLSRLPLYGTSRNAAGECYLWGGGFFALFQQLRYFVDANSLSCCSTRTFSHKHFSQNNNKQQARRERYATFMIKSASPRCWCCPTDELAANGGCLSRNLQTARTI